MDEIFQKKAEIRQETMELLGSLPADDIAAMVNRIEERLFDFANFLESNVSLLYVNSPTEVATNKILKRCFEENKIVILPGFDPDNYSMMLYKVDNLETDLKMGLRGKLEPDPEKCKTVPIEYIDIAIIPGVTFDEKGGRIGSGEGYYDRLIPELSITTRKVALAYEKQILPQVPMESHDKYVDIIISEKRIIYKI